MKYEQNVNSILELVNPVMQRLAVFSPGTPYDAGNIKQTIRSVVKRGKVEGVELMPDQIHFKPVQVDSNEYKLLVAHTCKVYVDLVIAPQLPQSKHRKHLKYKKSSHLNWIMRFTSLKTEMLHFLICKVITH